MGNTGDIRAPNRTVLRSLPRWKEYLFFWACLSVLIGGRALCGSIEQRGDAAKGLKQAGRSPPVSLSVQSQHVVLDNGILQLTLSNPGGMVTGLRYQGVENLMESHNLEDNRGYWDLVWNPPSSQNLLYDRIYGTNFSIIVRSGEQVEVSFIRTWDPSSEGVPLHIDRRYVLLRGCSGYYTYAIFEHLKGWPDFDMPQARVAIKLSKEKFHYMAIADDKQRIMPRPEDRMPPRAEPLAFKEAVRLVDPINPELKGEIDCKYQYSKDNKDNQVHGWISSDPPIGFWQITPSDEFRTGGPVKQSLTSHVGPTTLAVFVSDHYAGRDLVPQFRNGEYWKKVFGPVFFYLNSSPRDKDPLKLWEDAKSRMQTEVKSWPYDFPASEDFPKAMERGSVSGKLLVRDRYVNKAGMTGGSAYVGLALPGEAGSWQKECKGYQFWTKAGADGSFSISNIRTGEYNLYAWVPGFIGDFKYAQPITITAGSRVDLGALVFHPPRNGPTLWEIGIPDRSASEFYIPDPNPKYINRLFVNHTDDRYRQYGLWERYTELYPARDLVYQVGTSSYSRDWFYAHVTRGTGSSPYAYRRTTWQIKFKLDRPVTKGSYTLRIAIAAAARNTELQVRINDPIPSPAHFTTGAFGGENAVARHGIHGLYRLVRIDVPGRRLVAGQNTIYLTQQRGGSPFMGIMYDYIRLEAPPSR